MDLPPLRFEMLRLDLNPRPEAPACIPVPGPDAQSLSFSMVEAPPLPRSCSASAHRRAPGLAAAAGPLR
ncbi:hypothetical protein AAJV73_00525 [Cyanobium sp. BSA11S]|uniref:hypothetical protein n=1 Tax=Cyanobium sp. BSA11S TaxID=3108224 RepID=UPI003D815940